MVAADYEQQRRQLLHKHGIDLEDSNGIGDGTKTKRMDRKDVELLMGEGNGQGGLFTWREKNRRKVWSLPIRNYISVCLTLAVML
jgi:protein-serine/threonine kinase